MLLIPPGGKNLTWLTRLGRRGFSISTGSACSSAKPEPSHVLLAIGLPEPLARASLRFGLGRGTSEADVERAAADVIAAVRAQRGR